MAGILLISGPSGSGKSTLLRRLFAEFDDLYFSISSTTRSMRDGEVDGVNYHFTTQDEFKKGIENGEFLEWALVHNNYYGTSLKPVKEALSCGKIVIFDIDVQGHELARARLGDLITSVFITTKSKSELKKRLISRDSDDENTINLRLDNACEELGRVKEYDYFIVNDDIDEAYEKFRTIFLSMKLKACDVDVDKFLKFWNLN